MVTREQFAKDAPLIVAAAFMITGVILSGSSVYFALLGAGYGVFLLYKTRVS